MFAAAALLLISALSVSAITVDSPAINQCQDVTFTITGAVGETHVTILPSTNPCESEPFAELGPITLTDNHFTWNANVPAGTSVLVLVDDSTDAEAWSSTIVVGGGASSCNVIDVADVADPSRTSSSARSTSTGTRNSNDAPVNAGEAPEETTNGASAVAFAQSGVLAAGLFAAVSLLL